MKKNHSLLLIFVFLLINLLASSLDLEAQTPRDSLTQSVQQLQSTTGDAYFTLLEKIIDISTRVKPLPAIPETANEKYVTSLALREDASSKNDFDRPISLLKEARTLAPWWPDVYKELGITFELAAVYDTAYYVSAIANFQRFLRTQPIQEEARKIQNEIYIVNAKKEKAIKVQKEKQDEENRKLNSAVGEWFTSNGIILNIEKLTEGSFKLTRSLLTAPENAKTFMGTGTDTKIDVDWYDSGELNHAKYELSDDGKKLVYTFSLSDINHSLSTLVFLRK